MFWEENEKQLVPAIIFMMACFIMQSLQQESFVDHPVKPRHL